MRWFKILSSTNSTDKVSFIAQIILSRFNITALQIYIFYL